MTLSEEKLQLNKKKVRADILSAAVFIPLFAGAISAYLTADEMQAYETFPHPPLAPPAWVFPIVWTILYAMMGISSYLVVSSDASKESKRSALIFYAAQLAMNFFWSTLFFTYEKYLLALIWLLVMWVLILICAVKFYRIRKAAGIMMSVLFIWTTFAAYLNLAYFIMSLAL